MKVVGQEGGVCEGGRPGGRGEVPVFGQGRREGRGAGGRPGLEGGERCGWWARAGWGCVQNFPSCGVHEVLKALPPTPSPPLEWRDGGRVRRVQLPQ